MIRCALSIAFLLSVPCYAGTLEFGGNRVHSMGRMSGDNGRLIVGEGLIHNVTITNDLVLEVKRKLVFGHSSIGNTLLINSGTVELKNIKAKYLIVKDKAIVYIDDKTCEIVHITKDDTATVSHELPTNDAAAPSDTVPSNGSAEPTPESAK